MNKILLLGLVIGIVNLVLGLLVGYFFMMAPPVTAGYANSKIIRALLMTGFYLYPFIVGWILAWVWGNTKGLFKGSWAKRGVNFGWVVWLVGSVPGMYITYVTMPLAPWTGISGLVGGLVTSIAAGLVLARINNRIDYERLFTLG